MDVDFSAQFSNRLEQITNLTSDTTSPTISFECLLDAFLAIYTDCKGLTTHSEHVNNFLEKYEKLMAKVQKLRVNTQDFDIVQTLATGAVGKVCLVREKSNKKVYAMKILKKMDLLTRREAAFFMEERNALVFAQSSPWITTLYSAFQDDEHLYLVMEYASGGSLRALINNHEENMPESEGRFYVGEILVALEELHKLNFIHRDVKPENCLIDSTGHIKLADFGSCMRITSGETVGTPDYISPEILRANEGNVSYGQGCDWWSLGIILYELLFDEVPFYSESLSETYGKIMDHERFFAFPEDCEASDSAKDLIKRLICNQEIRIGKDGAEDIKRHVWFANFDWEKTFCRETDPPFIPELNGPDDTRYFEDEEDESKKVVMKALKHSKDFCGNSLPFIGYTYLQNAKPIVTVHRGSASSLPMSLTRSSGVEQTRIVNLEAEIQKLKLASVLSFTTAGDAAKLSALQHDLERETMKNEQLQEKLAASDREKDQSESCIKQFKLDSEHDGHEREDLQRKLAILKESLKSEVQSNLQLQDALESQTRLERQIIVLKIDLDAAKLILEKTAKANTDVTLANTILENGIENFQRKCKEAESSLEESKMIINQLDRKHALETQKAAHFEKEVVLISGKGAEIQMHLTLSESKAKDLANEVETLHRSVVKSEREMTAILKDYAAAVQKVQELSAEKDGLSSDLAEQEKIHQRPGSMAEDSVAVDLQQTIIKNKQIYESEIALLTQKIQDDAKDLLEMNKKIAFLEERSSLLNQAQNALKETNATLTIQQIHQMADFDTVQNHLRDSRSQLLTNILLCSSLEKEKATNSKQILSLSGELEKEIALSIGHKTQAVELERLLDDERRLRLQAEISSRNTTAEAKESRDEVQRLHLRISSLKDDQISSLEYQQTQIAIIKKYDLQIETMMMGAATNIEQINMLEAELSSMKRGQMNDAAKFNNIALLLQSAERNLAELHIQIEELNAQILEDDTQIVKQAAVIADLEQKARDVHSDMDLSPRRTSSKYIDNSKQGDISPSKSAFGNAFGVKGAIGLKSLKLKTGLFRANSDKEDGFRTAQKIRDTGDESKSANSSESTSPASAVAHQRKISNSSFMSSKTAKGQSLKPIEIVSKLSIPNDSEFDSSNGLKGWLKVPKGGKIKKGWKKVYAIVRESIVYTYDKEKDADDSSIKPLEVFDLRSSIIYIKTVTQAEVIHANSKDIDSIFKVHLSNMKKRETIGIVTDDELSRKLTRAGTRGSIGSLLSSEHAANSINVAPTDAIPRNSNAAELNKRVAQLQAFISIEEKYAIGAQAILKASITGNQKVQAQAQLSQFYTNIFEWKAELNLLVGTVHAGQPQIDPGVEVRESLKGLGNIVFEQDLSDWRKDHEEMLKRKQSERNAKQRLCRTQSGPDIFSTKLSASAEKDTESSLAALDKEIGKLKEELEQLNSNDRKKVEALLKTLNECAALSACNGHFFKKRVLNKPLDCGQCKEALWLACDNVKTVMECEVCHAVCHSYCKLSFDITCQDYTKLKNIQPCYFMAVDASDRNRWLAGLGHYIKEGVKFLAVASLASETAEEESQYDINELMQIPMMLNNPEPLSPNLPPSDNKASYIYNPAPLNLSKTDCEATEKDPGSSGAISSSATKKKKIKS